MPLLDETAYPTARLSRSMVCALGEIAPPFEQPECSSQSSNTILCIFGEALGLRAACCRFVATACCGRKKLRGTGGNVFGKS